MFAGGADDVAAALVTHVHSNTGVRLPVREIAGLCRQRGIFCIVDVAQSAGVLEVSIPKTGADVVLGSCVKWLCGGPGAGFIWIDPRRLASLEPADVGWFSHANPFELDIHSFTYAPDARRFWGGTPSIAPFALAAESIALIAEIGAAQIQRHNRALARVFLDEIPPDLRRSIDLDAAGGAARTLAPSEEKFL
ncbi:MAG: aminotransferase class V-fold PLP-dependent enzyme [Gammaproteobacteria bacterium]